MTFGEKKKGQIEKTVHISFHITGDKVDQIDWYGFFEDTAEEDNLKITNGNVNIYYTEKK